MARPLSNSFSLYSLLRDLHFRCITEKQNIFLFPFLSVCVSLNAVYVFVVYAHICGAVYMQKPEEDIGSPFLMLSTLFPWNGAGSDLLSLPYSRVMGGHIQHFTWVLETQTRVPKLAQWSEVLTHQVIFPVSQEGFLSRSLAITLLPNLINIFPVLIRKYTGNTQATITTLQDLPLILVFENVFGPGFHFVPLVTPFLSSPLTLLLFSAPLLPILCVF